jgi:phage-related protein (TIGR01555 family)
VAKKIKKVKEPVSNGLTEALFGGGWNPNSGNTPGGYGVQLSQVNTLFKNNRWYLVSNYRQLLSEIYVEHGLVQAVVDVPVDDGLRGGVEIKTKQLDPEEIEDLYAEMDKQGDLTVVGQALKWNRLFGGAGVIIITDQDPKTPIDVSRITENSPLEFRAVDMWELFWDQQNTEGYNIETQQQQFEYYSYYATKLHKSRVMAMKGLTAPSFIRPRLRGWGFSIVEALVRSINQYLKANDLTFEVLDEFKLDVYKIKNLTQSLLSATGTEAIQRRVQIANMQKNYQNAISMDSEDDYLQKELSFAGLAETMTGIRMQVASDLRMPLTKIFGISAQGFNSGEDDIENYNAMVESQVRQKCKYDILKIIEIRCQKKFGFIPDDLQISFKPLRMLSAEQEENVKTQKFNRLLAAKTAGEIDSLEFRDACNKDQLLPIQLDTDKVMLTDDTAEGDDADDAAAGNPVSRSPRVAKPAKDSEEPKEAE